MPPEFWCQGSGRGLSLAESTTTESPNCNAQALLLVVAHCILKHLPSCLLWWRQSLRWPCTWPSFPLCFYNMGLSLACSCMTPSVSRVCSLVGATFPLDTGRSLKDTWGWLLPSWLSPWSHPFQGAVLALLMKQKTRQEWGRNSLAVTELRRWGQTSELATSFPIREERQMKREWDMNDTLES